MTYRDVPIADLTREELEDALIAAAEFIAQLQVEKAELMKLIPLPGQPPLPYRM